MLNSQIQRAKRAVALIGLLIVVAGSAAPSINKRENGDITEKVLKNKEGYRMVSQKTILPGNGYDGFYIAVIERD